MPEFRQEDADELHRNSRALYGGWEKREDGVQGDRHPGLIERLRTVELAVHQGVLVAAGLGTAVGGIVGALITAGVLHALGWAPK